MNNITLILNSKKETPYLRLYKYSTNIDYNVEILILGEDVQIKAIPPVEYSFVAPEIIFFSKESRFLKLKSDNISMNDVPVFTEWVNKANELLNYIYEYYEEIVPQMENDKDERT